MHILKCRHAPLESQIPQQRFSFLKIRFLDIFEKKTALLSFFCFFNILLPFHSAYGSAIPAQGGEQWKLCHQAIRNQERSYTIPPELLTSIAVAESGRWHPKLKRVVPWPWTVMAEGKGRYFQTKEEALRDVEQLRKKGVRNIDIGCMQVNLHYHGRHFASIEEAFEPAINAGYAAKFLRNLRDSHQSWSKAVGYYHSGTPSKNYPYRRKVMKIWKKNKRHAVAEAVSTLEMAPSPQAKQPLQPDQLAKRRRARLQTAKVSVKDRREWARAVFEQRKAQHKAFAARQQKMMDAYRNHLAERLEKKR